MEKIQTADWNYIKSYFAFTDEKMREWEDSLANTNADLTDVMRLVNDFANKKTKFHVQAALEAADKRRRKQDWIDNHINLKENACKKAILSAYPLENIK